MPAASTAAVNHWGSCSIFPSFPSGVPPCSLRGAARLVSGAMNSWSAWLSHRQEQNISRTCLKNMTQPQITYRGMPHSPAMDARIVELAARLDELHPRISRCHVVVAESDQHKHKG